MVALTEMFLTLWASLVGTSAGLVGGLCGNAVTPETVEPLTMALWERARQGHPVEPWQLRAHSDAGGPPPLLGPLSL